MRPHSARLAALLAGPGVSISCRAESWYAGELLDDHLPVTAGTLTTKSDVINNGELALSTPLDGSVDLSDPLNAVGAYGQRTRVFMDVAAPSAESETVALGWYRNTPSTASGRVLDLRARDLTLEVERARLVTPVQLTKPVSTNPATETFDPAGAVEALITGILPVAVVDALPALSGALYVMRDRRAGLEQILQAVSATATVDVSGALVVSAVPDLSDPEPVLTFTDGQSGTVTDLQPEANASRGYNACIVQGVTAEGAPVYGGAFIAEGPMAWPVQDGVVSPYGANPGFYFSPLLRTVADCTRVAQSTLDGWVLGANGTFSVTCAPDPRLEVDDVVALSKGGSDYVGLVQDVTLPLTATSGQMTFSGVLL